MLSDHWSEPSHCPWRWLPFRGESVYLRAVPMLPPHGASYIHWEPGRALSAGTQLFLTCPTQLDVGIFRSGAVRSPCAQENGKQKSFKMNASPRAKADTCQLQSRHLKGWGSSERLGLAPSPLHCPRTASQGASVVTGELKDRNRGSQRVCGLCQSKGLEQVRQAVEVGNKKH